MCCLFLVTNLIYQVNNFKYHLDNGYIGLMIFQWTQFLMCLMFAICHFYGSDLCLYLIVFLLSVRMISAMFDIDNKRYQMSGEEKITFLLVNTNGLLLLVQMNNYLINRVCCKFPLMIVMVTSVVISFSVFNFEEQLTFVTFFDLLIKDLSKIFAIMVMISIYFVVANHFFVAERHELLKTCFQMNQI